MTQTIADVDPLYKVHPNTVEMVDVPELNYLSIEGSGDPAGPGFAGAIQALFTVSYGAHFLLKKQLGDAPRVMPLEALWWLDDPRQIDIVIAVALGKATMNESDRDLWRWQAMLVQLPPIDASTIDRAIEQAHQKAVPMLDKLRFESWAEGRCAQTLHIGPYADEGPSVVRLHQAIKAAGYRPRGRHHEIYLGDPRRSAPEKLRTILRHPIEPV